MIRTALLTLALLATPAFADPPEEEPTAAPASIATGMIEEANAIGVFDIVHNGQVSVRHLASGLRCDFENDGAGGSLALFPGLPRGDNVACDFEYPDYALTLYASRYPGPPPLNALLAQAVQAIGYVHPGARSVAPANGEIPQDAIPPRRRLGFIVTIDGVQHFTSVHIAQVGAWTIKQRYTSRAESGDAVRAADLAADRMFDSLLADLVAAPNL